MAINVALIVIFNHRYDKNLPILRNIYKGRFSNIYFLVPFYDGDDRDVIPVYENSFYFQGYVAQGFKSYFETQYDHYFFVADDMVLNPSINENNYGIIFNLNMGEDFIPEIFLLNDFNNDDTLLTEHILTSQKGETKRFWGRTKKAYLHTLHKSGVEIKNEIPEFEKALSKLKQHGYSSQPLSYSDIFGGLIANMPLRYKITRRLKMAFNFRKLSKQYPLSYPVVASYSDIFIVSKNAIPKFIHYCGVFATTELFVEIALPTALLLASAKIKTEPQIGKRGILYWNYSDEQKAKYKADMGKYNFNLQQLLAAFPADKLYLHPVKLSQWKTDF